MAVNTAYLNTGANPTGLSDQSQIAGSFATFVAAGTTGTLTAGGAFTASGAATVTGTLTSSATLDATAGPLLSRLTTASLTSATLADGELAFADHSANSLTIYFRSGATTYTWTNDTGAVA